MTYINNLVSLIVRTNNEKRLPLLRNALLSIVANDYTPIEVIIVVQTENQGFVKQVQELLKEFVDSLEQIQLVVNETSRDERAKNLNLGIQTATGRYIGFLDDDDIIYPNHISLLIEPLKSSEITAWSYSDVAAVICQIEPSNQLQIISIDYPFKKENFSREEFWKDNFIPIHSYLLDRERIIQKLLKFNESFKVLEDYDFLLRIAALYLPEYIPIVTCEYRFFTDASNSNFYINQLLGINYAKKAKIWQEATIQIEKLKQELMPDYNPGLIPVNQRKFLLARFAFLYKIKLQFPRLWSFMLNLATQLKLIK